MSAYRLTNVGFDRGRRSILDQIDLSVEYGEVLALVGPNGAGKSTLLSLLAGDERPARGELLLGDRATHDWSAADLARQRSVLLQRNDVSFPFTVRQVIAMGRDPWVGHATAEADEAAICAAIAATDVEGLLERTFQELSGGERARVSLARVLAQDTPITLLDEPTAALDLRHQEDVLALAADLAGRGRAMVVVLHDLSLAAAYADRIAVLSGGTIAGLGPPDEVLTGDLVETVYRLPVHLRRDPDDHLLVIPQRSTPRRVFS